LVSFLFILCPYFPRHSHNGTKTPKQARKREKRNQLQAVNLLLFFAFCLAFEVRVCVFVWARAWLWFVSSGFSILLPPLYRFFISIELFISALIHTRGVGKRNNGNKNRSPSFFLQQFFIVLEGKEPDVTFVLGGGKCRGRHTA